MIGKRPYSVTVVIIGYYADKWMGPCLDTLRAAAVTHPMKVIVVDNAGNTEVSRWPVHGFDLVMLKTDRPMGFADANNFALQQCPPTTDVVCFLNQDTKSGPGWLDACLACMEADEKIGALMPSLRTYDDGDWDVNFRECAAKAEPALLSSDEAELPACFAVHQVTGAAMLVRTDVLRQIGPFDPIFVSYYEDYDMCLRVRQLGYANAVSGLSRVYHYNGSSTTTEEARRKRMRQIIRNRAILRFREAGALRFPAVLKYLLLDTPRRFLRAMLGTESSQPLPVVWKAHVDLLKLLPRVGSARRDQQAWRQYLDEIGWPSGRAG